MYAAFATINAGFLFILGSTALVYRRRFPRWSLAPVFATAVLALIVNGAFLVEVAAPRLLHMPSHHCPYDLISKAPESLLSIGLFCFGFFAVGWGCLADWLGWNRETTDCLPRTVSRLLLAGLAVCALSIALMVLELSVA
jgi:hypothetical protein